MLTAARNAYRHFAFRAGQVVPAINRAFALRRVERLYGPLQPQVVPALRGLALQFDTLHDIVSGHCRRSEAAAAAQNAATGKLDSAEYLFSSMLDELRGVMSTLPSSWIPDRAAGAEPVTDGRAAARAA